MRPVRQRTPKYRIRCTRCGEERDNFHGWAFTASPASGCKGQMHDWKPVEKP